MEEVKGTIADETINAPATSGTTGVAATTLDSGDVIDGGEGTDTLNITMTATNNNSLAGVTVKNVEKVYVTGANFQTSGETGAALTAATAAKAATAASLSAAQAAVVSATQQGAAADAVTVLATSVGQTDGNNGAAVAGAAVGGNEGEDAVVAASTITVASAASNAAAATYVGTLTAAEVTAKAATTATVPTGATAFTAAQMQAAAKAALLTAAGVALDDQVPADALAIVDRAELLATTAESLKTVVDATQQDQATAVQIAAATTYIANHPVAAGETLESTVVAASTATALPAGVTTFTLDQYKAAALAALSDDTGATLITANDDSAAIALRAGALALEAAAVVNYGSGNFTLAQLNSAASAALSSNTGVSLLTNADDSLDIQGRAELLDTVVNGGPGLNAVGAADTALAADVITAANTEAAKAVVADNTAASALAVATAAAAAVADATLSAASFAGSEEVWLVGANSNKTDLTVTTQAAGLSGVTGVDNKITFGTTGTLAVAGSTGTVDIAGAAGGLTIGGTGGTLTLKNTGGTTEAKAVKALTISTSGAMAADVTNLAQLTTVTSNGEGGATISGSGAKLATILTGDGADSVKIGTTTAKDNKTTTAKDETLNADVSTGAGNDTVNISTTGAGTTTVDTGAGNDTIYVQTIGTGVGTITTGEGNDTVNLTATLAANPSMTIAAGDGVDTLVMAGGGFTAVDYLRMNTALSGFEAVTFNTAVTALDVSKLEIGSVGALNFQAGANTVTKVGAQTLNLTGAAKAYAGSTNGIIPAKGAVTGGVDLVATAAGYVEGIAGVIPATNYAGSLAVTSKGTGATQLDLHAASATVDVISTGGAAATANAEAVTLSGSDIVSLVVNLTSARGTGTNAAAEYVASFDAGTIATQNLAVFGQHLEALSSLTVNGTGTFTIDTGATAANLLPQLKSIDLSGMDAMADLDVNGLEANTNNLSTSTVALNDNVSETVILGGARDTIATDSTVAAMDTITGFQVTASAASALVADTTRSDVLDLTTAVAFTKFVSTTASTFAGILSEAGAAATGGVATDNLVFHFGGNTYVYVDTGNDGLTDNDVLVELTGTLDLDLMTSAGVIA